MPGSDWGLTDLGNADRLVGSYSELMRYCTQLKKWYVWNGEVWAQGDAQVFDFAKQVVRNMADALEDAPPDKLAAHAVRSESYWSITSMVKLAATDARILVTPDDMDADPWLLNCRNGVLDLHTGRLRAHEPDGVMHTKCCPLEYRPEAKCPRWEEFLHTVFQGNDAMVQWIQKAFGYTLTGSTREQVVFFCYGVGMNGKSTMLEAMRWVLGEYAAAANSSAFMQRASTGIRNDIARLKNRRFVTATEVGQGKHLDEVVIKQLTGEDTTTARFLYTEEFEFRPMFKIWMAGNHKPAVSGTDHAIWRRMRLVPFDYVVSRDERDPELPAKLKAEAEGILAWAVRGALLWQLEGLGMPQMVADATLRYREEMDGVGFFLVERCVMHPTLTSDEVALYDQYGKWATAAGDTPMSKEDFTRKLTERSGGLVKRIRVNGGWALRGIDIAKRVSLTNLIDEGAEGDGDYYYDPDPVYSQYSN